MEEQFAALPLAGKIAAIICMLSLIYAAFSAFELLPHAKRLGELGGGAWQDSEFRPKLMRVVRFTALGAIAAGLGLVFGGWPAL